MLLAALKDAGADVKVFIRDAAQWPELQALGAKSFALGDMADAKSIDAAVDGCDRILHIGPPMHPHELEITSRFIDAAKRHRLSRFIYYSVMHPLLRDLAQASALIATQPGHEFASYELAGPELLSQEDMAAIISRLLGREIRAEALSLEAMAETARAKGASDDRVTQMLAMNTHYDAHGFRGNSNVLRWILGRSPTVFSDYVERLLARG
jgi:uncharacterized protein YbjT (DUF2867 family)